jgi:hypothetical protein
MPLSLDEISDRFHYHKPSEQGTARHQRLSSSFVQIADVVNAACPEGREKSLALTKLEEAKFWASAAVARNPETR